MAKQIDRAPVSAELAALVAQLKAQLKQEFGCDFSYVILGQGELVAAYNLHHGEIDPALVKNELDV